MIHFELQRELETTVSRLTLRRNFCLGAAGVSVMALGALKCMVPEVANAKVNGASGQIRLRERVTLRFPVHFNGPQSWSFVTGVVWSPDGSRIAAIGNYGGTIAGWTLEGKQIAVTNWNVVAGPYVGNSISFLTNDIILIPATDSTDAFSQAFTLLNISNGSVLRHVSGPVRANIFEVFDDGRYVAAYVGGLTQPIWVYSTRDWTKVANLPWHLEGRDELVTTIVHSPHAEIIAVGVMDGTVRLFSLQPPFSYLGTLVVYPQGANTRYPLQIGIASLAFSPDGKFLAIGADASVGPSVINGGSNETESPAAKLAHAPVQIWQVEDWRILARYTGHLAPVVQLSWSANSMFLAAAAGDNSIRIFTPGSTLEPVASVIGDTSVPSIGFAPIGEALVAASGSTITIYDIVSSL